MPITIRRLFSLPISQLRDYIKPSRINISGLIPEYQTRRIYKKNNKEGIYCASINMAGNQIIFYGFLWDSYDDDGRFEIKVFYHPIKSEGNVVSYQELTGDHCEDERQIKNPSMHMSINDYLKIFRDGSGGIFETWK